MIETIIKSVIGIIVSGLAGYLIATIKNYRKKNDGIKNGVMTMLQSNLTNTYYYYETTKTIPDYMYNNCLNELKAYEDLDGNDYVHVLAEHMKHWEISRTDILKEGQNEHKKIRKKSVN